jgi:hypothetical protein
MSNWADQPFEEIDSLQHVTFIQQLIAKDPADVDIVLKCPDEVCFLVFWGFFLRTLKFDFVIRPGALERAGQGAYISRMNIILNYGCAQDEEAIWQCEHVRQFCKCRILFLPFRLLYLLGGPFLWLPWQKRTGVGAKHQVRTTGIERAWAVPPCQFYGLVSAHSFIETSSQTMAIRECPGMELNSLLGAVMGEWNDDNTEAMQSACGTLDDANKMITSEKYFQSRVSVEDSSMRKLPGRPPPHLRRSGHASCPWSACVFFRSTFVYAKIGADLL